MAGRRPGSLEELKTHQGILKITVSAVSGKEIRYIAVNTSSPLTFSLVFLSTEPASLVATHLKSPLWLADAALITRAPSLATEYSDCSGCSSRPFLNQRTLGWGEPAGGREENNLDSY